MAKRRQWLAARARRIFLWLGAKFHSAITLGMQDTGRAGNPLLLLRRVSRQSTRLTRGTDTMTQEWIDHGNREYRDRLAQSLLSNMSHEEAIDLCVTNEWLTVLNDIMAVQTH